jgi:16S rRNA (guanine527-N7)-methyltransferase
VLDSVMPWRLFADAKHVLDAGSGAGFPGTPLALVLPEIRFTLAESVGKKARFLDSAVKELALRNVQVANRRAEDLLKETPASIVTARAIAPLNRIVALFAPVVRQGTRALLYKGPDSAAEIAAAEQDLTKLRLHARVVQTYELPDAAGSRTVVELTGV